MIGFELNTAVIEASDDFKSSGKLPSIWLVQKLMDAGLLTVAAGPKVIRWLPPMNTTETEVREGLRIMREVLGSVGG
jgi:acetylornithine/succinyldiaminopimelate/putrescine aminotransferase